jgi:preprotein translocase subunit SecG
MGAYVLVSVLILIICVLLILIVLVQNSKGGGLASNFQGSNQHMGVRQTTDFLEKSTWTLAIALLALSMISIFVIPRSQVTTTTTDQLQERIQNGEQPINTPNGMPMDNPTAPTQ